MRFVLIIDGGFENKGSEAMLRTVQGELNKRISGLEFAATVALGDIPRAGRAGVTPVCLRQMKKFQKLARLVRAVAHNPFSIPRALSNPRSYLLIKEARDPIACIDIKGFGFSDVWRCDNLAAPSLDLIKYCRGLGIPYVCMPQAWGPFSLPKLAADTRAICLLANAIYARDEESKSHLDGLLTRSGVNVNLAPDVAFRFQPDPPEVGKEILLSLGLKIGDRTIVGVVPNRRIYDRTSGKDSNNEYVRILVSVVEHYVRLGAQVVLIPHEIFTDGRRRDDRCLCRIVKSAFDCDSVAAMVGEYSAEAIKSTIGHLETLVGSRFHSLVGALSCRVPAVAIGWSHKYIELMRLVGQEMYAVHFSNLELPALLELLDNAWNNRSHIKRVLELRLPQVEREVDSLFDSVAQLIHSGGNLS